ncbi:MAG: hypothetical protein KDB27_25945 [Planctomycetales bacterium]|nr:hypothetical protein [Planctomycetales bacterium]
MSEQTPTVVFIDDKEEELRPLAERVKAAGINGCTVDFPDDVDEDTLKSADLVVVDHSLDEWITNVDVEQISLKPPNGIALASVLREHSHDLKEYPPTGFALITGKPNSVSATPGERRPHIVARLSNLEWFFEKQTDTEENVRRITSLAEAIHDLPEDLSNQPTTMDRLLTMLAVDNHELADRFHDDIERCRPPIHHIAQDSGGLILIRWLLHRVLPHTCFLFDYIHLAARLRVTPQSLKTQLSDESVFGNELSKFLYRGLLANFDGNRWWRGGIEQWLWDKTDGNSAKTEAIHALLDALQANSLEKIDIARPVVTLNEHLEQLEDLSPRAEVVPVQLDDWPSYAEPGYVRKDLLAEHDHLKLFATEAIE